MKILIYGAGVLGSLYAVRLKESGQDVTILARGQRLDNIRQMGIILEDVTTGRRTATRVNTADILAKEDRFDLVIVLVRKDQIASVLPSLSANIHIPNFLFMINNAAGSEAYSNSIGRERVLLGFAGAGGERDGNIIRYIILPKILQPTSIGELDGSRTIRIQEIAGAFRSAGLPTVVRPDMDAWLKTHIAVISPIANAIYMAGGDNYQLARNREAVGLTLSAIREGLQVLRSNSIPITPKGFKLLKLIPDNILAPIFQIALNSKYAEIVITRHANAARSEMRQIADEFRELARQTIIQTPAMNILYTFATSPEMPP